MRTIICLPFILIALLAWTGPANSAPQQERASLTPEQRENLAECKRRLTVIGSGLAAYRRDHKQQIPLTLEALYPKYVKDTSVFYCPAGDKGKEKGKYEWIFGFLSKADGSEVRGVNTLNP